MYGNGNEEKLAEFSCTSPTSDHRVTVSLIDHRKHDRLQAV